MSKKSKLITKSVPVVPGIPSSNLTMVKQGYYTCVEASFISGGKIRTGLPAQKFSSGYPSEFFDRVFEPGDIVFANRTIGVAYAAYSAELGPMIAVDATFIVRARDYSDYLISYLDANSPKNIDGIISRAFFRRLFGANSKELERILSRRRHARKPTPVSNNKLVPCSKLAAKPRPPISMRVLDSDDAEVEFEQSDEFEVLCKKPETGSLPYPFIDFKEVEIEATCEVAAVAPDALDRGFGKHTQNQKCFDLSFLALPGEASKKLGKVYIASASGKELRDLHAKLTSEGGAVAALLQINNDLRRWYEDRIKALSTAIEQDELEKNIKRGETARLEFKSSLRWNVKAAKFDEEIECSVLKTIVAFCNTKGGQLLIGVGPECDIVGVQHDRFPDDDKFMLHLRNLLSDRVAPSVVKYVEYEMRVVSGKTICVVNCLQSRKPIWLKSKKTNAYQFYVRSGPSSAVLDGPDQYEYIKSHFE